MQILPFWQQPIHRFRPDVKLAGVGSFVALTYQNVKVDFESASVVVEKT